jgi:branched-chain amino acid transport system substrate-binding protein
MIGRRTAITVITAVGALVLAACGSGLDNGGNAGQTSGGSGTIKIGYVSPQTGALAPFGEADTYVINQMTTYFKDHPLKIGGTTYQVQVILKDAASDSKRAGEVAADLINNSGVDLILASSTPDIVNPVADQCEANAVPCITTVAPWQPYYFGRGGTPDKPFKWTYHFFWGLEDVEAVYLDMWNQVPTNKKAGALWPNDPDGKAWGDKKTGFGPVVAKGGYTIIDPGFYPTGTQDFTAQISKFKAADAQVLLGVPIPPDFINFWKQAQQQGYHPKIATIGKSLLFPSVIEALGDSGINLGTEVWWSPNHPFKSSLTGQSAQELADAYQTSTGKQWTQPLGFSHALFEVAVAALTAAGGPDKQQVATALSTLKASTIVGDLDWTSGPVPNVAKTPLVGGQWRKDTSGKYKYNLVIVSNKLASTIPLGGKVEPLP